ncbi:hypothetical protein ASPWEDRAFT_37040 [Aspergillus wentii DTO 134E9]|uniref:Uncharacterized protein n=1 Tax=Aspergillus wentii DTO 134E9 TaxID=1073089 RepID=A0A1L9RWG3_ASPWE|nr:uncharacterized protein ASPWEDRAFT_37040 [Aspergillus wentii DTO 134E9]OJJ39281.1 hypothetical protein ASPWEDRAFT_37040 [Aspergillus wentii DTO 134E9]
MSLSLFLPAIPAILFLYCIVTAALYIFIHPLRHRRLILWDKPGLKCSIKVRA